MSNGAILGVKLAHQDGKFSVQPAWISQNIAAPLTPSLSMVSRSPLPVPSNAPAAVYALRRSDREDTVEQRETRSPRRYRAGVSGSDPVTCSLERVTAPSTRSGSQWNGSNGDFLLHRHRPGLSLQDAPWFLIDRSRQYHAQSVSDHPSLPVRRAVLRILSGARDPARQKARSTPRFRARHRPSPSSHAVCS